MYSSKKIPWEFIEGSGGMYRPIRVLFDTPIYERAEQVVWHTGSYKCQIALVAEMLRLQQRKQLPSAVTAEDMSDLLVEESKSTLRVRLWEFELEGFEADVEPLLKLAFEVNTSLKMRDVEFEARRLLNSPQTIPPQFKHPKIISQAHQFASSLTEQQQQETPSSKLLRPREVVMEVVPKVVQGFWSPPSTTSFNMPSKQLSKMAVGVTQAVLDRVSITLPSMLHQVIFSRSIRDHVALSIQEKVRQGYTPDDLMKKLNCFATEVMKFITDVAVAEICLLFQPQTDRVSAALSAPPPPLTPPAEDPSDLEVVNKEPTREPDSAEVSPAPSPPTPPAEVPSALDGEVVKKEPTREPDSASPAPSPPTPPAEVPSVLEVVNKEPTREPDSAEVSPAPSPPTPPAEDPSVLDGEVVIKEPTREPDSASPAPSPPTPPAEDPSVLDGEVVIKEPTREPDSAEVSPAPSPPTPPAEDPSVLDGEVVIKEPTREPDSASPAPSPPTPPAEDPSVLDGEVVKKEPTREPDSASPAPSPPTPPAEDPSVLDGEVVIKEPTREPDSASPAPSPPTPPAEDPSVLDGEVVKKEPTREPDSASPAPSPPTPPAEDPSVLDGEVVIKEPTREPDSAVFSPPPPPLTPPPAEPSVQAKRKKGGVRRFLSWWRKTFSSGCLP